MGKRKGAKAKAKNKARAAAGAAEDEPLEGDEEWMAAQRSMLEHFAKQSGDSSGAQPGEAPKAEQEEELFSVRRVEFQGRQVPLLLQNRNGPCALLAAANALLLRGSWEVSGESLRSQDLVSQLSALCRELNAKAMEEDPAVAAAVTEVIESMPKLLDGMLVNCDFSDCGEFEDSSSTGLFELFKLQLFHVWVDREVHKVAPNWNDLMDYLGFSAELQCILAEEQRAPSEEEEEKLCRASFLQEWLQANRAQATGEGIEGLQAQVSHGDVCVLFRNNHFCTVYRPAADLPCSDCCALLTDECFHGDSAPLWEILTLEGGQFLDAKFCPMEAEGLEAVQSANTWPSLQRPEAKPKGLLCPSCKKSFSTRNGLLCHRTAKSH